MNLLVWQIVFSVSIFLTIILCCVIPALIFRNLNSGGVNDVQRKVFSWLNCLTAGVFLAMCFLSLLPNVQQHFLMAQGISHAEMNANSFPVAECIVVLGYFLVLTIEQLSNQCSRPVKKLGPLRRSRLVEMDSMLENGGEDYQVEDEDDEEALEDHAKLLSDVEVEVMNENHHHHHKHKSHHDHALALLNSSNSKGLKFLVLLFAVVAHAFFEGIVLGLQDDFPKAVRLFVAIVVHEAVVAALLGLNISKSPKRGLCTVLGYSLLFAVTIPVGIWIGIGVGQTPGPAGHYISGTVQGLAAGMFLHITFMQLIPEEFGERSQMQSQGYESLLKTLFLFIGFLVLLLLNAVMGGHH